MKRAKREIQHNRPRRIRDPLPSNYRPYISAIECEPIAAMLPNPLSAEQLADILLNWRRFNLFDVDVDKTDHRSLRKVWNDIGLKSVELQRMLRDPGNVAPEGMHQVKLVSDLLEVRDPLLKALRSIEGWAGKYLDFLEQLAKERRGGRSRSRENTYAQIVGLWVARGGRASISADGPLARFLVETSLLLFKDAPDPKTIPGIVKRANQTLARLSDLNKNAEN